MGPLIDRLEQVPIMAVMLFLTLTVCIVVLVYLQMRRDSLDLRWLILDDTTTRPSIFKIGQLAALLISSWGFIYLTLHDKLSEFYFAAYMGIWAGSTAVDKIISKKDGLYSELTDLKPSTDVLKP